MIIDPCEARELLQCGLALRAKIAVIEITQIFSVADAGVVNVGVPMVPKTTVVLGAH